MKPKLEPILKPPTKPADKPEDRAAVLFVHGYSDDGPGCENIPDQFQAANKLPHALWLLPTAPENRDAMDTAWYTPTTWSVFPPSRPELAEDEDEAGMLDAVAYLEGLVADVEATHGVPAHRIVLAGFSQGAAMSLLLALVSERYAGRLAGVVGLMGFLPLGPDRIAQLRSERKVEGRKVAAAVSTAGDGPTLLLVRAGQDRLIPRRIWNTTLDGLKELDVVGLGGLEVREYEGLGHRLEPIVLRDMCTFLEKIIPGPEG